MLAIKYDDGGPVYVGENDQGRATYYEPSINEAALFKSSADLLAFIQTEIEEGFQFRDGRHEIIEVDLRPEVTRVL